MEEEHVLDFIKFFPETIAKVEHDLYRLTHLDPIEGFLLGVEGRVELNR